MFNVSQVSLNRNMNTDQTEQLIWGGRYIGENLGDGYRLLGFDTATGEARLQSPNAILPYRPNLFGLTCTCPGYHYSPAGRKTCRHMDNTRGIGQALWLTCWKRADCQGSVTASRVGLSLSGHYNLPTVPVEVRGCGELEADFRQECEEVGWVV